MPELEQIYREALQRRRDHLLERITKLGDGREVAKNFDTIEAGALQWALDRITELEARVSEIESEARALVEEINEHIHG